jgi:hypothetical protein
VQLFASGPRREIFNLASCTGMQPAPAHPHSGAEVLGSANEPASSQKVVAILIIQESSRIRARQEKCEG